MNLEGNIFQLPIIFAFVVNRNSFNTVTSPCNFQTIMLYSNYRIESVRWYLCPELKVAKNKKSLTVDYAALIAQKQADKDAAANEIAAVAANIEELKAELKSKKTAAKKLNKELAKLVAKKAAVEAAAAEAAKRGEAEAMLKKLLAEGMSADEIIDKLK